MVTLFGRNLVMRQVGDGFRVCGLWLFDEDLMDGGIGHDKSLLFAGLVLTHW